MNPVILTGPAVEPVSLADVRLYLRLDTSDEDTLLASLLAAARLTVEAATRLKLVGQSLRTAWPAWPTGRALVLPFAPVLAIEAVAVPTRSGPVMLDPASLQLDVAHDPPRLLVGASAPEPDGGSIIVDARYGFGEGCGEVPEPLRLAIRRLVARWYAERGDGDGRPDGPALPADVSALLAPFRRARLV